MKKVVITGCCGKAGRATARHLAEYGYHVLGIDIVPGGNAFGDFTQIDLMDLGQTMEAFAGADAIIHHAAIPAPGRCSPAITFQTNVITTYNVFQAVATLGIGRVVWASSETTLGLPFDDEKPAYAPIDELHPLYPESSYALSKVLSEEMARQFHRWSRGKESPVFIGLRLSNIMELPDYRHFPSYWPDATLRKWNLWGYIDAEDVAQACRLGITVDTSGAQSYIIAAGDTVMDRPSKELMEEVFPDVPLKTIPGAFDTLLSIGKAREELGFDPSFSWRNRL